MKRGTLEHPKVTTLAIQLGVERWGAVGILESLWHWAARYAIRGDVGRWSNTEIAAGIKWAGDPDVLVTALVDARWLDRDATHRLVVHDVCDHADNTWRQCLEDAGLKWWNGSRARRKSAGRPKKVNSSKTPAKLQSNSSEIPQPEPEPEPVSRAGIQSQSLSVVPDKRRHPTRWPDDLTLTPERAALAADKGFDPVALWGKFKDRALRDGARYENWHSAWRVFIRNEIEFAEKRYRR